MALLVFLAVGACYWPAAHGGFLWDDNAHVTRPELQSWAGLGRIWTEPGATQQYYPVLHSVFWVEHRLWGAATFGYHLANMLQHALACCLFALFLRRLWGTAVTGGAEWIAALLLAVHPVSVESVAWISEQKNTLSLVFYLAAALCYLAFDDRRKSRFYAWAGVWFVLAVGTKSVTATLPAALLVMIWWKRGALRWRQDVLPLLPWFGVAVVAGGLTAWVERTLIGASGDDFSLSLLQRLLLAGRIIWFYLGKLVWPADLIFIYPRWEVSTAAAWWGGLVAAAGLTVGLVLIRRRVRGPLAAWLFFVGSLVPALGFVNVYPFRYSYVADHFQYLPSLGIYALAAAGVSGGWVRISGAGRGAATLFGAGVFTALAILTYQQSETYQNSLILYRVTLEKNPDCWLAQNNLGLELSHDPRALDEAIAHCREAIRLKSDLPEAHLNLGLALAKSGRLREAIDEYAAALRLRPQYPEALFDLGNALGGTGRTTEAMNSFREALRLKPIFPEAHGNLARLLVSTGRQAEALAEFEAALRLDPAEVETHNEFGVALLASGRGPAAIAQYEQSLRLNPAQPQTHYRLAAMLDQIPGREADARQHYEEALRLNPRFAEAHNNLAILFAQQGKFDLAREHWRAALQLKPDYEDAQKNLRLLDQRAPQR